MLHTKTIKSFSFTNNESIKMYIILTNISHQYKLTLFIDVLFWISYKYKELTGNLEIFPHKSFTLIVMVTDRKVCTLFPESWVLNDAILSAHRNHPVGGGKSW